MRRAADVADSRDAFDVADVADCDGLRRAVHAATDVAGCGKAPAVAVRSGIFEMLVGKVCLCRKFLQ